MRRLDARRVEDLRALAGAVDLYWSRGGALPGALDSLTQEQGFAPQVADPETGRPYEYRILGGDTYELCASFARGTDTEPPETRSDFWSHGAGRQCFQLEAKKPKR